MDLRPRALEGLFDVATPRLPDERGFLFKPYQASDFAAAGITPRWDQVIQSHTDRANTVRGLYIQLPPYAEGKLVASLRGETWWVVVDLRPDSPTFARWEGTHLKPGDAILIARGFAHGCLSLSDDADLLLLADNAHARAESVGIAWDDPDLAIDWPLQGRAPIISEAHAAYPPFAEVRETLRAMLAEAP